MKLLFTHFHVLWIEANKWTQELVLLIAFQSFMQHWLLNGNHF